MSSCARFLSTGTTSRWAGHQAARTRTKARAATTRKLVNLQLLFCFVWVLGFGKTQQDNDDQDNDDDDEASDDDKEPSSDNEDSRTKIK